mmetsp:Transcript_81279/g.263245  ORF Transcript_81279/g.263245 Transcript_81279/m.263245 type:complete len:244 (-) Transcript_81279:213-944(-)
MKPAPVDLAQGSRGHMLRIELLQQWRLRIIASRPMHPRSQRATAAEILCNDLQGDFVIEGRVLLLEPLQFLRYGVTHKVWPLSECLTHFHKENAHLCQAIPQGLTPCGGRAPRLQGGHVRHRSLFVHGVLVLVLLPGKPDTDCYGDDVARLLEHTAWLRQDVLPYTLLVEGSVLGHLYRTIGCVHGLLACPPLSSPRGGGPRGIHSHPVLADERIIRKLLDTSLSPDPLSGSKQRCAPCTGCR